MAQAPIAEISRQDLQRLQLPPQAREAPQPWPYPGSPSLWCPPPAPRQLPKDSGLVYISQNAARHPDIPLEPLCRDVYVNRRDFDIPSIDVITDRNNNRKLLSFNGLDAFTITIEVAGRTALFCCKEPKTSEVIGPKEHKGFGHEFDEKACTASKVRGSTGHQRIITYSFGGHKIILRHGLDGYFDAANKDSLDSHIAGLVESMSLSSANLAADPDNSRLSGKPTRSTSLPNGRYSRWTDTIPTMLDLTAFNPSPASPRSSVPVCPTSTPTSVVGRNNVQRHLPPRSPWCSLLVKFMCKTNIIQ
ncbi:hypothetical protein jhhlp_000445 [Lomentospora prolificans]|uniref:Uncharacterized protein n=1 Tax=Lomentospora prolificans TaxID=41688 RepID=A0A2N3NKY6_9PEZI|nr:hypothetical protein jhhlp_000445 [Lomentospora prolificans]